MSVTVAAFSDAVGKVRKLLCGHWGFHTSGMTGLFWTMGFGFLHKVKASHDQFPLPSLGSDSDLSYIHVKYSLLVVWAWINGI